MKLDSIDCKILNELQQFGRKSASHIADVINVSVPTITERIKKLLGLSSPAEISMVISAGKRAENGVYGKQIRFESKYFIHEV